MSLFLRRKNQRYISNSFGIPKFGEGRNTISICNKILGKLFQGMNEEKMRNKHYSQSGYNFWSQFKERVQLKGLDWGKKAEREHFGLKKKPFSDLQVLLERMADKAFPWKYSDMSSIGNFFVYFYHKAEIQKNDFSSFFGSFFYDPTFPKSHINNLRFKI